MRVALSIHLHKVLIAISGLVGRPAIWVPWVVDYDHTVVPIRSFPGSEFPHLTAPNSVVDFSNERDNPVNRSRSGQRAGPRWRGTRGGRNRARVRAFPTSAEASLSGCRQHHLAGSRLPRSRPDGREAAAPSTPRLRAGQHRRPGRGHRVAAHEVRDTAHLAGTAHSIPDSMAAVGAVAGTRRQRPPPRPRRVRRDRRRRLPIGFPAPYPSGLRGSSRSLMIRFWISLVPSKIVVSRASRQCRSTCRSVV